MAGQKFPDEFDNEFAFGLEPGNSAFFGRNVLRGLIAGIDDFIRVQQPRWKLSRSLGPVMLGSTGWITDRELIEKIGELAGASIVICKQDRGAPILDKLREVNESTPGLPVAAFAALSGLAIEPVVIGPYNFDDLKKIAVPTIRTIGYRRDASRSTIPPPAIIHAKLALLGHLHDDRALGLVDDVVGFSPRRLWVSSANFTTASRYHLEFGFWTEDEALVRGAERFLTSALRYSEGLDPDDPFEPELVPVVWDEQAFLEDNAIMRGDFGEQALFEDNAMMRGDFDDDPF